MVTPRWYVGDVKGLALQLVQNSPAGQGTVDVVPAAGVWIQVGLALEPGGTVIASALVAFADGNQVYRVKLPLTDADFLSAMAGRPEKEFVLELRRISDGESERYQGRVVIGAQALPA